MAPLWAAQPFKASYCIFFSLKTILLLSTLSIRYVFKSLRPIRELDFGVCLKIALLHNAFRLFTAIRYQYPRQLEAGKLGDRFALISPPDPTLFSGALASPDIKPAPVGAIWHPSPVRQGQGNGQKVIIQFSGGAFVLGWDPNAAPKLLSGFLTTHFKTAKLLYVQYRLAAPGTHFPAPLQDALTAYNYVLSLGVAPDDIILCGDSAGGNIVIALLRYLETFPGKLPSPGGAIVWSPWVHVTSHAGQDYKDSRNSDIDLLYAPLLDWGANTYIPKGDLTPAAQALISPLHHPFQTKTPIFIQAGTHEAFYDAIRSFSGEMTNVEGNRIRFHETKFVLHDLFLSNMILHMDTKVQAAVEDAQAFFEEKT
ncbi:alpha/beta-hydrolase [Daldinia vernicosa]|uniref:alpha/beta-hydrolase n=1 Tax=Daldinia vernicosa TaxID=114800 RepID=UPI00200796CE|nr:alpha/beta-hydrolase [Daldinia vernicosa]KAI0844179.1 alpha/beta-hydrolase [Daldinia vernicosa]